MTWWANGGSLSYAATFQQTAAFLSFYVTPSRQLDGLRWRLGCRRCLPDRVASPREERSQQSYLSTALRCVSGQVLLSAIPQVLIYQLSVQTEHRSR